MILSRNHRGRGIALLVACLWGAVVSWPARAEVVGIAVFVNRLVTAYPPSGEHSRELKVKEPIERGLKLTLTGETAALRIALTRAFGCRGVNVMDQRVFSVSAVLDVLGNGDATVGKDTDRCRPELDLRNLRTGKIRLAVLPGSERPTEIKSPHATVTVSGTRLRMLIDPTVGTFVAVDEGEVTVQADAGGAPVQVKAGNWVLVPPGALPTRPAPLPPRDVNEDPQDPPLCCGLTDRPKPPADFGGLR
jgi:hypothetical protein